MPCWLACNFSGQLTAIKLPPLIIGLKHDCLPPPGIAYLPQPIPNG
jgi:hypothetical protein